MGKTSLPIQRGGKEELVSALAFPANQAHASLPSPGGGWLAAILLTTVDESVSGEARATGSEGFSVARQGPCIYLASRGGAGIGTAASRLLPSADAARGPALKSRAAPSQAGPSNGKSRRNLLLKLRAEGRVTRQR